MPSSDYIELRTRSSFSFLEGATTPEDLAARAAELGYPALALGDRDGMYGQPRFFQGAKSAGIHAIVGAELTLDDNSRLYVLVPDRERYRNLCRMITNSKLRVLNEGSGKPPVYPAKGESRITLDELERFGPGLICLAGGAMSPLARMLVRGADPLPMADRLGAIFGKGNLYVDLQRHLDAAEERLNRRLAALAAAAKLPITATNDVCHGGADRELLDALTCIRLGTTLEEAGRSLWVNNQRHLKSRVEMTELFRDLPKAVAATRAIAERCAFRLTDMGYRFPDYPLPPGETPDSYLRVLTYAGARDRWGNALDDRTRRQLEHELEVIARLKLAGYFLIVWDIVQFCRENRIMVQGRGSAANSAVCYALAITAVDAVKMELLFERFLSEERGEWPDIDLDLPSGEQREQAIQYVYRRYGERGAAMTANVITYRTRSAVREIGKVLGFAPEQVDRLAKLNQVYEFRDRHDDLVPLLKRGGVDAEAPRILQLVDLVRRIQSLPRHLGQHSGGMVIAAQPLDEIVPLEPASMPGRVVVQWDKDDCADLGIIKIDLLGLGMLAALEEAIPIIREHEGVEIDLAHLPPDDPDVYAMMRRADTVGVFQIESRAQMATLPRMKPEKFYDLVVEVAIIRPGPIVGKMVHPYLDRRNKRAPVEYAHPSLEPILRRTLGVPLFQEQLLRIAMTAAGFSGGEAEELRRAMGFKRSVERMEKIEERLRAGMARKGMSGTVADDIVRSITSFALYGFPESHAASFALIAYASAYLKYHHPAAFFAAMLNCYPMGFYHPSTLVKDAERHGASILPVDVTKSNWRCTVECVPSPSDSAPSPSPSAPSPYPRRGRGRGDASEPPRTGAVPQPAVNPQPARALRAPASPWSGGGTAGRAAGAPGSRRAALAATPSDALPAGEHQAAPPQAGPQRHALRLGLRYVAGLREEVGSRIEAARDTRAFDSIADFSARVGLNRRELDALAYAGAFAAFGGTRRNALWNAAALERDPQSLLARARPQPAQSNLPAMGPLDETLADYAATGVTAGPHLMTYLRAKLKVRGVLSAEELPHARHESWVKTAGVVIVRQRPGTAKGFLFITLEDETGIANLIVTPDLFQKHRLLLRSAGILLAEGVLQQVDGVTAIRARRFAEIHLPGTIPPSHDFH
ncbi:MAG TPA: error-prone DNA polymerase [Candidatus Binataceae bacterium]|nr:error-prone DNA polymerase [Candidatus Binataceae bacterium]